MDNMSSGPPQSFLYVVWVLQWEGLKFVPYLLLVNILCCILQGGIVVVDFLNFRAKYSTHVPALQQQYFSHPRLVIYFFPAPSIELKLGIAKGGRLLTATHLDESNHVANQQQVLDRTCSFNQPVQKCWAKTILPSKKPACFDFSSSKICCTGWCTSGVALRNYIFLEPNVHCTCLQMTCHCCCVCTVL